MFGYVKPYIAELKVCDYEKYRAVYCGLCRCIGRLTGQFSRLSLSYDLVFLAAVRMAICGTEPELEEYRCPAHILRKRLIMCENEVLDYTAAISAVLANAKLEDDISDEHGVKRLKAVLAAPFVRRMLTLSEKVLPRNTSRETGELLEALSKLEKDECASSNLTADAFGKVLEYAFAYGLSGNEFELASKIGRHIGRYIYICDAADDMVSDIKHGRYNPLALGWGELALQNGEMSDLVRDSVMTAVPIELEELETAVNLLPETHTMTPIIKNIVYIGLPTTVKHVLYGENEKKHFLKGKDWIVT